MLFSLRELVQWLGFAHFEIFLHVLAVLIFSVLLVLKVDGFVTGISWWNVFIPFFAADGLSTYFTTIVSVRLFQDGDKRLAVLRLFWILTILSLKFVFEMLLCQKLGGTVSRSLVWTDYVTYVYPTSTPNDPRMQSELELQHKQEQQAVWNNT